MADPKSKFDPSLFDEDDEFEEFPTEGKKMYNIFLDFQ